MRRSLKREKVTSGRRRRAISSSVLKFPNEGLISLAFSKFFKLSSSLRDSGNFVKTLKIRVKSILNCPRAHAITDTNQIASDMK